MRWNVVNYFFHRISYINLPQKSMWWIFARNEVHFAVNNFCKKCGEMRWNIYFHCIHRNHRISYKNSQRIHRNSFKNLPKNLDPGYSCFSWLSNFFLIALTLPILKFHWFLITLPSLILLLVNVVIVLIAIRSRPPRSDFLLKLQ